MEPISGTLIKIGIYFIYCLNSIFQPTPKQKQKLNKMENDRIMKNKRLKEKLDAQKKARKTGHHLKGPTGGGCCTDPR